MGTLIIHWIHQLPWVFVLNLMETLPVFSIWIKVVGQLTQRLLAFPQTAWLARQKNQQQQLPIIAFTVQKLCHHTCKGWSKENRWVLRHYYLNFCRAILRLSLSLIASVSACSPAHLCHLWSKKQQIQPEPVSASPQSVSQQTCSPISEQSSWLSFVKPAVELVCDFRKIGVKHMCPSKRQSCMHKLYFSVHWNDLKAVTFFLVF